MRTEYIDIPNDTLQELEKFLQNPGHGYNTEATYSANFGNGLEVDIKLCDVPSENTPYVDAVMFHDGNEIGLLDVGENLAGEYIFDDPDNKGEKLKVIVRGVTYAE